MSNNDSDVSSKNSSNNGSNSEIKEIVLRWLEMDDKLKNLSMEMKEIKDEKKQYEEFILNYMSQVKGDVINTSKGNLRKSVSQIKTGLKPDNVLKALQEVTSNEDKAREMMEVIMKKREVKERIYLKRNKLRNKEK